MIFRRSRTAASSASKFPTPRLSGAQGWFINTRREKFKDRRLREALMRRLRFRVDQQDHHVRRLPAHAFAVPEFATDGHGQADAAELALLEPLRGKVPDEVFGEPFVPPVTDGSGQDRRWLRRACQLLTDAGFPIKDGKRLLPSGEPLVIEFLIDEPTFEPHHQPYIKNSRTLGIEATLRMVDPVQYRTRVDDFDFDMTIERLSFSATPGDSLRTYFSSQAAATKGSQNLAGIANPAIDALIDQIIAANHARI